MLRRHLLALALVASSAAATYEPFAASEALRRATHLDRSYNPLLAARQDSGGAVGECENPTATPCPSGNGCSKVGYFCCPEIDGLVCREGTTCGPTGCCGRDDGCPITGAINVTDFGPLVPAPVETTAEIVSISSAVTQVDVNLDTQIQYTGPWVTNTSVCTEDRTARTITGNGSALIVFDETVAGVSIYLGADPWAHFELNISNSWMGIENIRSPPVTVPGCDIPRYRWKFWQLPGVNNYVIISWVPPSAGAPLPDPKGYLQRIVAFRTKEAVSNSVSASDKKGGDSTHSSSSSATSADIWGPVHTNMHSSASASMTGNATGAAASAGASGKHSGVKRSAVLSSAGGIMALAVAAFVLL